MKKSLILILASACLLSACQQEAKEDTSLSVSFDALREGQEVLKVNVGTDNKVAPSEEISALVSNYEYHTFVNWYTSKEAAEALDAGENDANIFDFDVAITSSITVYAGYEESWIDQAVTEKIELTLGSYQTLDYSPLPLLDKTPYSSLDDTYSFKALNVDENKNNEAKKLLTDNGFTLASEGKYLDKLGRYFVSLEYADNELTYTLSFNDEEGELPANALGTLSSALDASLYLEPDSFSLAKNEKDEDLSKKFLIAQSYSSIITGLNSQCKTLFYTPKETDSDPATTFATYLSGVGYSKASSSQLIYADMFMSSLVYVSYIAKNTLITNKEWKKLGVKAGMVAVSFYSAYTVGLDQDELEEEYEYYTQTEYPDSFPDLGSIGKATSLINGYSSGSNYGPGFFISGCDKTAFDAVLNDLYEQNYTYSKSESTYYWTFNFASPTGEYVFQFKYYDSSKVAGLLSDVCQVIIIRKASAYETLAKWMEKQNKGGGTLTSIPELPVSNVTGSANSSYPYAYTVYGKGATEADLTSYLESLAKAGFTKDKEEDGYYYFTSADGYYSLTVKLSSSYLYVYIFYNYLTTDTFTYAQVATMAKARLGVTSIDIPYLATYLGEDGSNASVMSVYDGSYQRLVVYGDLLDTEEAANAYLTAFTEAVTASTSWTYVGKNTAGTISFYTNSDDVYLYASVGTVTNSDESTSYRFFIGMYRVAD